MPEILGLLVDEVREAGVDVAGRDGVDAGEVAPLVGEGAGEVDAAGFGDIVGGLKQVRDERYFGVGKGVGEYSPVLEGSWRYVQTWKP